MANIRIVFVRMLNSVGIPAQPLNLQNAKDFNRVWNELRLNDQMDETAYAQILAYFRNGYYVELYDKHDSHMVLHNITRYAHARNVNSKIIAGPFQYVEEARTWINSQYGIYMRASDRDHRDPRYGDTAYEIEGTYNR